jgi:hypothetical protein
MLWRKSILRYSDFASPLGRSLKKASVKIVSRVADFCTPLNFVPCPGRFANFRPHFSCHHPQTGHTHSRPLHTVTLADSGSCCCKRPSGSCIGYTLTRTPPSSSADKKPERARFERFQDLQEPALEAIRRAVWRHHRQCTKVFKTRGEPGQGCRHR